MKPLPNFPLGLVIVSSVLSILSWGILPVLTSYYAGVHGGIVDSIVELILYSFLHLNFWHLFGNMLMLLFLWSGFSEFISEKKVPIFFGLTTLFVYGCIFFFSSGNVGGMSGFILAILSYVGMHQYTRKNPEYKSILLFLAINILLGLGSSVSLIGHLAGAIFGALYALGERSFETRK